MTFAVVAAYVAEAAVLLAFEAGVTGLAYAALYYGVVAGVTMVGWSLVSSALAPKQSGAAQASSGILVNTASTADPLPVIYGYRRFGGTRVLCEVSDKSGTAFGDLTNGYLHLAIAHCEGEVASIPNLYADNVDIWDYATDCWYYIKYTGTDAQAASSALIAATSISRSGTYSQSGTTVTITSTDHKRAIGETVTLDYTSGTAVDGAFTVVSVPTADTFTVTAAGSLTTSGNVTIAATKWTANHKLSGVAYTWLVLKYATNVWHSVPTITADINGRKIYDPRSGLTVWSDNPALIIRDYLTNTRYGRGVSTSDIDDTSISAAANTCDDLVSTPTGTQKRYRINAIVDTSQPALDNLRHMLTACRGVLIFTGGKYKLIIDQATSPTFTFSEDNIVGAWSIKLGEKRARFNRVRANWINPDNDWQPAITVRDSTTFRTADNGLMLEAQIDYPYVTDPYQVQRLADMHLKQSRFGITCSFRATIAGMLCEVGDVVSITHATPGWTAKPFRVMRIGLLSSDEVEVTCTEYDASVYTPDTLVVPRVSETTNLPLFGTPVAPTALTLASGDTHRLISPDGIVTPRIYASWTASADTRVNEYEVQFKKSAESAYTSLFVPATETGTYLAPTQYGEGYNVRIRAVNVGGFNSDWVTGTHTVTASPSQPNDLPIDVQTFTSGGTWTKPSRGRVALIETCGGGGAGARYAGGGGGGGGGLYVAAWIPLSSLGATETVSIGAGGTAITGSDGPGTNGGNTTFGAWVTGYGGQGGATTTINTNPGGAGGGMQSAGGTTNRGMNGAGDGAYLGPSSYVIEAGPGGGGFGAAGASKGGDATYSGAGGGGGGSGGTHTGGVSAAGGNGGAGNSGGSNATAGSQPGGGGGGSVGGNSGAGGAGKCKVTVW